MEVSKNGGRGGGGCSIDPETLTVEIPNLGSPKKGSLISLKGLYWDHIGGILGILEQKMENTNRGFRLISGNLVKDQVASCSSGSRIRWLSANIWQ